MFKLTPTDLAKLKGVDPSLVKVIVEAAKTAKTPFRVLEGLRTAAKQAEYFKKGTSRLDGVKKKSKHQLGKAVDIVPIVNGKVEFRSWTPFYPMAANVKAAAKKLGVKITWGGDWKSFPDGPHFEL
jgi:peptidoglycan L-alanyl-D-glutamate endopeptidase CwlK